MTIITSGEHYTDLDGLACAYAYKELLELQEQKACVYLPGAFNTTVPKELIPKSGIRKQLPHDKSQSYVVVDVSDPKYIPSFVSTEAVSTIFDHHPGFEKFWKQLLGKQAHIEKVAACATLLWEEYTKAKKRYKISKESARLLYAAIAAHTLLGQTASTTNRDSIALRDLFKFTQFPKNWAEQYFKNKDAHVLENIEQAVKLDTKEIKILNEKWIIGQLELWEGREFIHDHQIELTHHLKKTTNEYSFTCVPSVSTNETFVVSNDPKTKAVLSKKLGLDWNNHVGKIQPICLRMELVKQLQKLEKKSLLHRFIQSFQKKKHDN